MSGEQKPLEFKLSAPGKVILFGEFSVVFNKPAIAATLCLKTKLHFVENTSKVVELNFSALGVNKTFAVSDVQESFMNFNTRETNLQSLSSAVEGLYKKTFGGFDLTDGQKFVDTELPVGSGVGSSASFSVVLSAAALIYEHFQTHNESVPTLIKRSNSGNFTVLEKLKAQISDLAFSCEKIFHGTPSGIDHSTILQGSMLEFVKSEQGNKMSYVSTSPIRIILVNTNVPRSTKKQLESVRQLKANHPEIIDSVLEGMASVAKSALSDLKKLKENSGRVDELEKHFGELITLNHGLLRTLGTSHPALERIVSCANKHNLNAKLTGAGGGGFGFIYLPSNIQTPVLKTIEQELTLAGFTHYEVTLGGPGLTVEELIH